MMEDAVGPNELQAARSAMLETDPWAMDFARSEITFLCTDPLEPDYSPAMVRALARCHDGRVEHDGEWTTMAFADANEALAVALHLQRTATRRLRCALVTVECTVAATEVGGQPCSLSLGGEHLASEARARRVPPGTIHLCARSWARLEDRIDAHTRSALVATELEGDTVTSAAITLPPPRQAALSTFAGLGLT
jgi:hypothetical protein